MEGKIGILGGTFDPIHLGHLILAEEVRIQLNLDKVIFIPVGSPPHKEINTRISPNQRYDMVSLAIADNPYFKVSPMEIRKGGISYTIDTIRYLITKYNKDTIYFITGGDSIVDIEKWKESDELLTLCKFVTTYRRGTSNRELEKFVKDINAKYDNAVVLLSIPYIDISSTDIRKKVKMGESIKYYVTKDVEEYIKINNLYR